MFKFSQRSKDKLITCHPDLVRLFNEVIKHYDCSVLEGYRSNERQEQLFDDKKTKLRGGQSKHNQNPSLAVDVAPYPIRWNEPERFYHFGGFVLATAKQLNIPIRWGGDWDGDGDVTDQSFNDLPHFELI
jgi:peptidoglycan L-alanyl-D-glutamate endopeptidase CwlK